MVQSHLTEPQGNLKKGCNPAIYQDPSKTVARNGMEGGLRDGT